MMGHLDLSDRIIECIYEVTDRLTYYLSSRKPNHRSNEHLIIPDCIPMIEQNDNAIEGRNKLRMVI